MQLFIFFSQFDTAGKPFWNKLESMLEADFKKKKWQIDLQLSIPFINALAQNKCTNENLWRPTLDDIDLAIQQGGMNNV